MILEVVAVIIGVVVVFYYLAVTGCMCNLWLRHT